MPHKVHKITFGCDPEVILSDSDGHLIPSTDLNYFGRYTNGFGCDGHQTITELRPGYSDNIIALIAKMELILQEAELKFHLSKKVDKILAGHFKCGEPIAGHIHIKAKELTKLAGAWPILAHMYDFFFYDCLEPLVAPMEERAKRQNHPGYGGGQVYGHPYRDTTDALRRQEKDRVEYRPLASWMIKPELMYLYLYVGKGATELFLNSEGKCWEDVQTELGLRPSNNNLKTRKVQNLKRLSKWLNKNDPGEENDLGHEILMTMLKEKHDWSRDIREGWEI